MFLIQRAAIVLLNRTLPALSYIFLTFLIPAFLRHIYLFRYWSIIVADPGCFIPGPGSWFLSIPDPTTATKEKKIIVLLFFVATNITKFIIILFLNRNVTEKFEPIHTAFLYFFKKKLSQSSLKDPGFGSSTLDSIYQLSELFLKALIDRLPVVLPQSVLMEGAGQVPTPGCPGLSHGLRGCSRFLTRICLLKQQI